MKGTRQWKNVFTVIRCKTALKNGGILLQIFMKLKYGMMSVPNVPFTGFLNFTGCMNRRHRDL
jgi:hypothetical protein